ncbi:MAG TPA: transcriptional regulator, partial [Casimicrobiaceae bacterium]|nr:transcriptional regulator [Casimicrobiaceae bacterium]
MTFARTKIQPPRPRPGFVPRGAVQARLGQALLTRRLVLLCAPAGYGKTTLLAEELARLPPGNVAAWVGVDAGDDLHRLLECMVAALEPFDPPWRTAPEGLALAASRGTADEQRKVAAELINTLDACDVAHGVIVFDDVHRVDDAGFFGFLDLVVERMCARWTVALTSRDEPPLALARWRARDELADFRQLQLQFARDEARRLGAIAGLDVATADVLFDRTQGWPAGLRIAVGSLAPGGPLAGAGPRALHAVDRPMVDFLVSEVVAGLRPDLAAFLQDVCVLPELQPARCEALTGNANAARLLDEVERLGLFVDVLDGPTRTLRLHDLFRDALLQRLALEAPARLAGLRERAAASEPDAVRRIGYLIAAGRLDDAAELAIVHLPMRMPMTGPQSAIHLLAQFPADYRERSPGLTFVRGLTAYFGWEFGPMFELMERAERGFAAAGDRDRELHARACHAIALMGLGRMDDAGRLLASMRDEPLSTVARIALLNAQAWHALETGHGHAVGGIVDAMLDLLEQAGRPDLWYQTTTPNRFPGLRGMARPLARHAELLLRVAGDEPTPLRGIALLCQGWGALWSGRLDEARELEERARADAEWTGQTAAVRGHLLALGAFRRAILGASAEAVALARERVGALQGGYREWGRYVLWFFAGRVAAICGDVAVLSEALAQIDIARARLGVDGAPERTRMREPLIAQLAWLEGRADAAVEAWRAALAHEEAIDVLGQGAESRIRLARALARRG